jgi:hypothetical protein
MSLPLVGGGNAAISYEPIQWVVPLVHLPSGQAGKAADRESQYILSVFCVFYLS